LLLLLLLLLAAKASLSPSSKVVERLMAVDTEGGGDGEVGSWG
jgi:hypothetical protein